MKKQYKIKRYRKINSQSIWRKLLKALLALVLLSVLVFVGISIYNPVYDFIMGNYEPTLPQHEIPEPEEREPEETGPEAEPEPEAVYVNPNAPNAVYLSAGVLADEGQLSAFLSALEGTEVDSVMIDIKDQAGMVLFNTANEDAWAWGATSEGAVNLAALSARLDQQGLSLVVRMSAFLDPLSARANRENAIRYQDSDMLWLDSGDANGKPWLNPYAEGARGYLTALAVEAVKHGASMVVLENVHFPDGSNTYATFGSGAQGVSRQQALTTFVSEITQAVEAAGGRLGVYLSTTAMTQANTNEVRYGGSPLEILDNTLVLGLLPYQFYNGFSAEGLDISRPYDNLAATVRTAAGYVTDGLSGKEIQIIPLLQGGNEATVPAIQITGVEVKAQIQAAQQLGAEGYILYNTGSSYALS